MKANTAARTPKRKTIAKATKKTAWVCLGVIAVIGVIAIISVPFLMGAVVAIKYKSTTEYANEIISGNVSHEFSADRNDVIIAVSCPDHGKLMEYRLANDKLFEPLQQHNTHWIEKFDRFAAKSIDPVAFFGNTIMALGSGTAMLTSGRVILNSILTGEINYRNLAVFITVSAVSVTGGYVGYHLVDLLYTACPSDRIFAILNEPKNWNDPQRLFIVGTAYGHSVERCPGLKKVPIERRPKVVKDFVELASDPSCS